VEGLRGWLGLYFCWWLRSGGEVSSAARKLPEQATHEVLCSLQTPNKQGLVGGSASHLGHGGIGGGAGGSDNLLLLSTLLAGLLGGGGGRLGHALGGQVDGVLVEAGALDRDGGLGGKLGHNILGGLAAGQLGELTGSGSARACLCVGVVVLSDSSCILLGGATQHPA